jgi:uncharacterized protein (DUF2252 family)
VRRAAVLLLVAGCAAAPRSLRDELERWNRGLAPAARQEKYARMAGSPFEFFRATNHRFWAEHAGRADLGRYAAEAWILGDLHVDNFGAHEDETGTIVYGLNDFDDACVGNYQIDLWRLATSVVLLGRAHGVGDPALHRAVDALAEAYLATLEAGPPGARRFTAENTAGPVRALLERVPRTHSRRALLAEYTRDGVLAGPGLAPLPPADEAALRAALPEYGATLLGRLRWDPRRFAVKSAAQRLHAGVGSLGARRYYVLIEGATAAPDDDIILDVKEERPATGASYGAIVPAGSDGERVARAWRALDAYPDDYLGWLRLDGRDFFVRALSPWKDDLSPDEAVGDLDAAAAVWGAVAATFHARGAPSLGATVAARLAGDRAGFRALVWERARAAADQTAADWRQFVSMAFP